MRQLLMLLALAAFSSGSALAQNSDVEGERLMRQCQSCHAVKAGARPKVGPNLHGMFGRKAAFVPGYEYSDALRDSKIIWTEKSVNIWLRRPAAVTPGTSMAFAGIPNAKERAKLVAYLRKITK